MKLFIPPLLGLGDALSWYFSKNDSLRFMPRIAEAYNKGMVEEVLAIFSRVANPAILEILAAMPFPITLLDAEDAEGFDFDPAVNSGIGLSEWDGYLNAISSLPPDISRLEGIDNLIDYVLKKPELEIPEKFFLYSDHAGDLDRVLADPSITSFIEEISGLPSVVVGRLVPRNPIGNVRPRSRFDYFGKMGICETLYLAKCSSFIVSSLTFLRFCRQLFGKSVVELLDESREVEFGERYRRTCSRTEKEYARGAYGLVPGDGSYWFKWPSQKQEIRETIIHIMRGQD